MKRTLATVVVSVLMIGALAQVEEGKMAYGRMVLRDGGMVMKDFHDCYQGDGWIAGVVSYQYEPKGRPKGS